MNEVRRRNRVDKRPSEAAPLVVTFFTMAAAEWRKLVAEVTHAFCAKRAERTASKDEQFGGR